MQIVTLQCPFGDQANGAVSFECNCSHRRLSSAAVSLTIALYSACNNPADPRFGKPYICWLSLESIDL
jgi:hypothetical protein